MKHRLILVIALSLSAISLVGTFLVSASKQEVSKTAAPPTREEVVRSSERNEKFCIASVERKPGKPTLPLELPYPLLPGQTATLLPDGRLLLVGEGEDGPLATAEIKDNSTGQVTAFAGGLLHARAWHSATLWIAPGGR
ncbi:MAG TPA: hypothetical protein VK582_13175 [Pyrinomonadaceae bacterium]|nr:hypothetical protein [Pyrinomonadaceae bacterium]